MNGGPFLRCLRWNSVTSLRGWHALSVGALFVFLGWSGAVRAVRADGGQTLPPTVWDAFFVAFAGPDAWAITLPPMLAWFVPHQVFFFFIGNIAFGDLAERGHLVIPRIGSRRRWWWGKIVTVSVWALGYTVLGLLGVLIGSSTLLPWSKQAGTLLSWPVVNEPGHLLGWTFLLFFTTLFAMGALQLAFSLAYRRSLHGFLAISIIALLSWLLGVDNPLWVRWLPGSQSMLLRHTPFDPSVPGFSFEWSLTYNAILAFLVIILTTQWIRRLDVFGPEPNA